MLTDSKVLLVKFLHLAHHIIHKFFTEGNQLFGLICQILKFKCHLCFKVKNCTLQSNLIGRSSFSAHTEKFKVAAEIKDVKHFLIFAVNKPGTKTCSATYHLPELRLTHNLFKEYKI